MVVDYNFWKWVMLLVWVEVIVMVNIFNLEVLNQVIIVIDNVFG